MGCFGVGCLSLVALVVVVVVAASIIAAVAKGSGLSPADMQSECERIVAEWAGIDKAGVTGYDVSAENASGMSWDFRGSYPEGDWACGGAASEVQPGSVMVYPGGAGSEGVPTEIYP